MEEQSNIMTLPNFKEMAKQANKIIEQLVDAGFVVEMEDDPYEYPKLDVYKVERL